MTHRPILRPLAQQDINEIWDYSADRWGVEQARLYTQAIRDVVVRLTQTPDLGAAQIDRLSKYRKVRAGSHHRYYRYDETDLIIVRVLHVRMDAQRIIEH
ncbi:MAG: type II toxin-antitoxin system RelE/ParE family toxin [Sphingomicrobium sp.]